MGYGNSIDNRAIHVFPTADPRFSFLFRRLRGEKGYGRLNNVPEDTASGSQLDVPRRPSKRKLEELYVLKSSFWSLVERCYEE